MILHTTAAVLLSAVLPCFGTHGEPTKSGKGTVKVSCKSEALIRGVEVLMRDVADIEAPTAELANRIGAIRLAGRPAHGFNRVFPAADIRSRLITAGLEPAKLIMKGSDEVVAQPLVTVLTPSDITAVTDAYLQAILDQQQSDVEFELLNKLSSMRVPPGRFDLSVRAALRNGRMNPTSAVINLEIVVDEEVFKTTPLSYRLRHFNSALTAARVVKKGEALDGSVLTMKRIEVPPGSNLHITSYELVKGMVAARDIKNGQQLRLADIQKPAVVHKNDLVTLIAKRGRIRVSTKAVALSDAPMGGRVVVRGLSNNKPVQAVVHGAGIVVIEN